jgi:hypothetical protein
MHTRDAGANTAEGHTTGTAAHMDTAKVAATTEVTTAATEVSATAAMAATATATMAATAASERLCLDCAHSKGDNRKDNSKLTQHHTLHYGRDGVLVSLTVAGTLLRRIKMYMVSRLTLRLGGVATVGLLLRH